ncbi:MAG: TIGR04283 family arsenosugar biosynthesis glycosyltransferase [Methylomonas sp.]|jgi:rSAM/selenodomain-associated transferase 2|uniref:TIGR04283 family arsenosugar biosynthesis glycosyltransferase n=1 Tax=Methylomonas sp. TaxID=418 RepID=UPI0025E8BAC6|nr:TIGR04283 family arsenosugar biosynthesis glycosyltransferase [Methylomonas sp.]MCK9608216.1 TIGR04283 family arsenosugar biosynthesis glycosyltransferase [Methylomonas sp.]
MQPQLSIVIPVINEAAQLAEKLQTLQGLRDYCQLIVVDGGSDDNSPVVAAAWVEKVLHSQRGRAIQMNVGAFEADADILLFLHADTRLPADAVSLIVDAVEQGYRWGRFDVEFDSSRPVFKMIAFMMNGRSRLTGIATGDQAMFVTRQAFAAAGGFPEIALMEDISLSSRLKNLGWPCCLHAKVVTSARRWQQHGVLKTILLMWCLRLAYFFGADPNRLAAQYYRKS